MIWSRTTTQQCFLTQNAYVLEINVIVTFIVTALLEYACVTTTKFSWRTKVAIPPLIPMVRLSNITYLIANKKISGTEGFDPQSDTYDADSPCPQLCKCGCNPDIEYCGQDGKCYCKSSRQKIAKIYISQNATIATSEIGIPYTNCRPVAPRSTVSNFCLS